jgi:hypothetical protein
MFGYLIALSLTQAASAAQAPPVAQAPLIPAQAQAAPDWKVAASGRLCAVHTAFRSGTVLSVFALPGQSGIAFLVQNPEWGTIEDGAVYALNVRFDGGEGWPVQAIARRNIDEDGPGLLFAVRPDAKRDGRGFMDQFATARAMQISSGEARIDNLALRGNHNATVALAQCLSRMWNGGGGFHEASEAPFSDLDDEAEALRI